MLLLLSSRKCSASFQLFASLTLLFIFSTIDISSS